MVGLRPLSAVRIAMEHPTGALPRTPLPASRDFPSRGNEKYGEGKQRVGGADIFLDHSGSTYIIPKLSLYSTGLMPPKVILIRSSLYQ